MNEVYIVFEKIKMSCNTDYDFDGFVIVNDSQEVGTNLSLEKLKEYISKTYNDVDWSKVDVSGIDSIMEYMDEFTENVMYKYNFQYSSSIYQIFESENDAKNKTEYLNSKYKNPYYYERFRITKANLGDTEDESNNT